MARFKRRAARRMGRARMRRTGRSRGSRGGGNVLNMLLPAALYGAGRQYISNLATPITSKIPLGQYADEALFGVVGYFMAKKGKGMVHEAGKAILTVEAASIGHQLAGSQQASGSSMSSGWQ